MRKAHAVLISIALVATTPVTALCITSKNQSKEIERLKTELSDKARKNEEILKRMEEIEKEKSALTIQKQEIEKKYQEQTDRSSKQIESLVKNIAALESSVKRLSDRAEEKKKIIATNPVAKSVSSSVFRATAYDLSYESCGKWKGHPQYGMTATGKRATYKRTIATDPKVIPMGSKVKITFPEKWSYLNGVFIAEDTGGAVRGNTIDVFLGDNAKKAVDSFGVQKIIVERM